MMGQNPLCILHSTRHGIRLAAGSGGKSSGLDLETPVWDLPPYHSTTACPWTSKSPLVPWFPHLHNGDDFYPVKTMPAENLAHSLEHRRPQPHASAWVRRFPRGGNGNPLPYSCLKKSHGQRKLAGYSSKDHKELGSTK